MPHNPVDTTCKRQVVRRLRDGRAVRRAGAFGEIRNGLPADGFFSAITLECLERDGVITAGRGWGTYQLTEAGEVIASRMRS